MFKKLLQRLFSLTVSMDSITPLCDSCGYRAEASDSLDEISSMVGMTCPKCGAVMITQEDVDKIKALSKLTGKKIVSESVLDDNDAHEPTNRSSITIHTTVNSHDIDFDSHQ